MAGIREAMRGFDIRAVAELTEADLDELAQDTRMIRNRRKLGAIVANAQRILELDQEYGSFQQYLRAHGDFDATLQALRDDFKFIGLLGGYVFLYSVGEEVISHQAFERDYRR